MKPQVYSIDLDGTLSYDVAWDSEQCLNAKPRLDVIARINELSMTNYITIDTARRWELAVPTVIWLRKNGVRFHALAMEKTPADIRFDLDVINDLKLL